MSGELGKVLEWDGQVPVAAPVRRALSRLVDALAKAERATKPAEEAPA